MSPSKEKLVVLAYLVLTFVVVLASSSVFRTPEVFRKTSRLRFQFKAETELPWKSIIEAVRTFFVPDVIAETEAECLTDQCGSDKIANEYET